MNQNMMGQNIVITEPSSNLRALGRNALAGKWKVAIIALIIYELCLQIPVTILDAVFGVNPMDLIYGDYSVSYYDSSMVSVYESMPESSVLSAVYMLLVTGAFTLGITLFFLALFRRQDVNPGDVFLGFERFGRALGLMLFQTLFIFLWSLLLIVPGIIAAIRYSQAFFVLADNPDMGIRECMNESKRMMKNNKAKYFCMNISFIGWLILASLVIGIVESVVGIFIGSVVVESIVSVIIGLIMAPVTAYIYSTQAGFYEILAGHLIKETEPAPIDPQLIEDTVKHDSEA